MNHLWFAREASSVSTLEIPDPARQEREREKAEGEKAGFKMRGSRSERSWVAPITVPKLLQITELVIYIYIYVCVCMSV